MTIRIRQTDDIDLIRELHTQLFPADEWPVTDKTTCWLMTLDDDPVGFCTADDLGSGVVFMTRAGVLPVVRGGGLQRRLIRVRTAWARALGATAVITYTILQNYPSMINLLKSGFKFYTPEYEWVGSKVHYFHKQL